MYVGKPLCFLVYAITRGLSKTQLSNNSLSRASWKQTLLFLLPGLSHTIYNLLVLEGLTMTAAGIYQMMNALIVFWSFILSLIYLRRKFTWHHYIGILLILSGLCLVGASSILWAPVFFLFFHYNDRLLKKAHRPLFLELFLLLLDKPLQQSS